MLDLRQGQAEVRSSRTLDKPTLNDGSLAVPWDTSQLGPTDFNQAKAEEFLAEASSSTSISNAVLMATSEMTWSCSPYGFFTEEVQANDSLAPCTD